MHITISLGVSRTEVKGGLFLDVIIGKGPAILELLSSENEALLIGGDSLLVLDFGLHVIDGVGGLDLKGDGLAGKGFHEDLHGYHTGQIFLRSSKARKGELTGMLS
jgi:hypothetical protein